MHLQTEPRAQLNKDLRQFDSRPNVETVDNITALFLCFISRSVMGPHLPIAV